MSNSEESGSRIISVTSVSAHEAMKLLKTGAVILDVRPDFELSRLFDVEQVIYCSYKEIKNHIGEFPSDCLIIIADAVGLRSKEVANFLLKEGFKQIYNLAGGIVDWEREGLAVTKDLTRMLSGPCMCQLKARKN